ncbi:MAG: hypothetical protein ACR2PR_12230 [Pseudohongiellaceae bacterium]
MMKKIVLISGILLAVVLGTFVALDNSSDYVVEIKLRQYTFLIPRHISQEGKSTLFWLRNMEGLDDSSGMTLFQINHQLVEATVEGYKIDEDRPYIDDISGSIYIAPPEELPYYYNPGSQFRELWQAKGRYANRTVEPFEVVPGWYKVYGPYGQSLWQLLSRFPDSGEPIPSQVQEFWVGSCSRIAQYDSCRMTELIDDIVIKFSVEEYNLHLLDELRSFVRAQVLEWKQDDTIDGQ